MAERRDRRVWNRTKSQWLRSVTLVGAVAFVATTALVGTVGLLVGTAADFIGPYIGTFLPSIGLGGAVTAGASVGLALAGVWGWIGRPRLLPADSGRTGGDTSGARFWTGADGDAADGAAAREAVTS